MLPAIKAAKVVVYLQFTQVHSNFISIYRIILSTVYFRLNDFVDKLKGVCNNSMDLWYASQGIWVLSFLFWSNY